MTAAGATFEEPPLQPPALPELEDDGEEEEEIGELSQAGRGPPSATMGGRAALPAALPSISSSVDPIDRRLHVVGDPVFRNYY